MVSLSKINLLYLNTRSLFG